MISDTKLIEIVAFHFKVSPSEVTSDSLHPEYAVPRKVCFYYFKEINRYSQEVIAKIFNRNRSTISQGIKRLFEEIEVNKVLKSTFQKIGRELLTEAEAERKRRNEKHLLIIYNALLDDQVIGPLSKQVSVDKTLSFNDNWEIINNTILGACDNSLPDHLKQENGIIHIIDIKELSFH